MRFGTSQQIVVAKRQAFCQFYGLVRRNLSTAGLQSIHRLRGDCDHSATLAAFSPYSTMRTINVWLSRRQSIQQRNRRHLPADSRRSPCIVAEMGNQLQLIRKRHCRKMSANKSAQRSVEYYCAKNIVSRKRPRANVSIHWLKQAGSRFGMIVLPSKQTTRVTFASEQ